MPLSLEQLISIAKNYWSSEGAPPSGQEFTLEATRLHARWEQELAKIDRWWAFLEGLERELPGFTIGDATATPDACFRCAAYPVGEQRLPALRWVVVGCVSILAPIYTVYGVQFEYGETTRTLKAIDFDGRRPEIRAPAEVIARQVEAAFESSPLPREIAKTPVPLFVQWKKPPETTLFHALFTNEPGTLP
jgi:hypothetical protein